MERYCFLLDWDQNVLLLFAVLPMKSALLYMVAITATIS